MKKKCFLLLIFIGIVVVQITKAQTTIDYLRQDKDQPERWKGDLVAPMNIVGTWRTIVSRGSSISKIEFLEGGELIFTDKYGASTKSTWSIGESYKDKWNYPIIPLEMNCCYKNTTFTFRLEHYDDKLWLDYGDGYAISLVRDIKKDNFPENSKERIKKLFVGKWMLKYRSPVFSGEYGIELKVDGTYENKLGELGLITFGIFEPGRWDIHYKEDGNEKFIYLDLFYYPKNATIERIMRFTINMKSITEDEFVGWEMRTYTTNVGEKFKRLNSFSELNGSDVNNEVKAIFLGMVTVLAIVNELNEEEVIKDFSSGKSNSDRLIQIWEEDAINHK